MSDVRLNAIPPGTKLGFIGLGHMGKPMCRHLHRAGAKMTIHNRSQTVVEELAGQGMHAAALPRQVAEAVGDGVIFLNLTNTPSTQQILDGPDGLLAALAPGSLIADMGSNQVQQTRLWQAQANARGADWLDSPVSGGEKGATEATLTIMCGGNRSAFDRALPLLNCLGKTVRYMGPSGAGQVAKLANQLIVAAGIAAVSEAFTLAKEYGIDLAMLREALLGGFAASKVLDLHGSRMIAHNFKPGGTATNQLKDVREASNVAERAGLHLPMLAANLDLWQRMIDAGLGELDHSGLYQFINGIARDKLDGEQV